MARRHIDKEALAMLIRELDGISNEQRSDLLSLLNEQKQYGLVWENHEEDMEELLREQLPVLTEVPERRILSEDKDAPNHILIEGDNLHALTSLCYTHEGKIDVIYIDPPYNLGKDFIYNDSYVDPNDAYKHSKWLSSLYRRLVIAHRLLSEEGAIFISINNKECAQLRLLCDEIFGENNFLGHLTWESTTQPVNSGRGKFRLQQKVESILCFAKSKENRQEFILEELESECQYPHVGRWGNCRFEIIEKSDAGSYNRETMKFPILGQLPRPGKRWQIGESKARELERSGKLEIVDGIVKVAIYPEDEVDKRKFVPFWSHFSAAEVGSALNGKDELNDIMGGNVGFDTVKPSRLISSLLSHFKKDAVILDFYAGSGTTLNATMALNHKDGGSRICILSQLSEGFCEEVNGVVSPKNGYGYLFSLGCRSIADLTFERNKRVIEGYESKNGEKVKGLRSNNLRYYKTDLVSRDKSDMNRRRLVYAATDLLCIKEGLYHEEKLVVAGKNVKRNFARRFVDDSKEMLVIYDPRLIAYVVEELKAREVAEPIKVYVFSEGPYAYNDDFREVYDKVTLCALPEAIYQAYRQVLPKRKSPEAIAVQVSKEEIAEAMSAANTYSYQLKEGGQS